MSAVADLTLADPLGGCLRTSELALHWRNADQQVNRWVTIHDQRLLQAAFRTASDPRVHRYDWRLSFAASLPPWSSPNVVCYLDHAFELVPLFVER